MKYLITIDYDGTLLHDDGTITERTKSIISKLTSLGNYIVICTARSRYHTKLIAEESGASQILISSNGAEIYDCYKEKIVYVTYLEKQKCIELYSYAKENNIRIIFASEDTEYTTHFLRNDKQKLIPNGLDVEDFFTKNKMKQCMMIGTEKDKIEKAKEYAFKLALIMNNFSNLNVDEQWFSVINSDSSKGNALQILSKYLNIPIENTIAIGNDYNDIPMFEKAGISVAVNNADDEIKKVVKIVTESNNQDGVAKFLETL